MVSNGEMTPEFDMPSHVLVAGIDGSGKSTLLTSLSKARGYIAMEPTSTERARLFRQQTAEAPITSELITERENIFLDLNNRHRSVIEARLALGENVATSGSTLVTILSHAVMKKVALDVGNPMDAVQTWVDDDTQKPDALYLTYAPFTTIRSRIVGRQQSGDELERFWGFNSLFFLNHYQYAWLETLDLVQRETNIECRSVDTSVVPINQIIRSIQEPI